MTKFWLRWTGWNSKSDREKRTFRCYSTCCWAFRDYKSWSSILATNWFWRARNDYNCLVGNPAMKPEIELFKLQADASHFLNEINIDKLSMLRALENGHYLSFRSWNLNEYPLLQNTIKHSWAVKMATQLKKSQYIIFVLQTDRKNVMSRVSVFDDCNLSNVKIYLNSEFYPYDDLNLDFGKKRYAIWYVRAFS